MFHNSVRNKKNGDTAPLIIDSPNKGTFTGVLLEFSLLSSRRGEIFGGGAKLPETSPTMLYFIQSQMQRP